MQTKYSNLIDPRAARLSRGQDGHLVLSDGTGARVLGSLMGAFPISSKGRFISLRGKDGEEIGILTDMKLLDSGSQKILKQELERAYFMPRIKEILKTEEKLDVLTMRVRTNKGLRTFQVRSPHRNVRSVGMNRFVIRDVDGNRYEISDLRDLSVKGQASIEEYL